MAKLTTYLSLHIQGRFDVHASTCFVHFPTEGFLILTTAQYLLDVQQPIPSGYRVCILLHSPGRCSRPRSVRRPMRKDSLCIVPPYLGFAEYHHGFNLVNNHPDRKGWSNITGRTYSRASCDRSRTKYRDVLKMPKHCEVKDSSRFVFEHAYGVGLTITTTAPRCRRSPVIVSDLDWRACQTRLHFRSVPSTN